MHIRTKRKEEKRENKEKAYLSTAVSQQKRENKKHRPKKTVNDEKHFVYSKSVKILWGCFFVVGNFLENPEKF